MNTPYQILTEEAIDKLNLEDKIWLVGYKQDYIGNLVAFHNKDEFDSLRAFQIDKDSFDINNYKKKKAYIIPGSERTQTRIKDMMDELDIRIVKDYRKADFFISNDNVNTNLSKNNLFFNLYGQYKHVGKWEDKFIINSYESNISLAASNSGVHNILYSFIGGLYFNLRATGKEFVPLYHFNNLCQDVVLDDEMKDYLIGMLNSKNPDDFSVVKKILPKIDISKNQMVLFSLFDEGLYQRRYSFERDKDCKNWIRESGVLSWGREPSSIIEDYHNRGVLTNEGFKYLELQNRERVHIYNGCLYNFKVSLKEEYKKYLK